MDDLLESGNARLVIDMSRVEYVSSAGWGVFASRINEIRQQGGDIKIFGMDPEVDSIFRLLGFDDIMRSFSILTEAIDDFNKPAPAVESEYDVAAAFPRIEIPPVKEDEGTCVDLSELSIRFESTTTRVNGRQSRILKIGGAIDASTAERFEREIDGMVHEEHQYLIVDLSDVIYVSSAGWGVIVKCMQRLNESAGMMMLAGMRQPIFKIFRDLGFEPLIPHYLTTERALDALTLTGGGEPEQQSQEMVTALPDAEAVTGENEHADEGGDEATALQIGRERDLRQDTDRKLRKLGWTAYGKRLMKRSKDDRKRKK
jgi:anti-sigma B factor antagonist